MNSGNSAESKPVPLDCALEAVLDLFTPMLDKWRMGTPISKLCYGLNNEHMKALEELDSLIKYGRPNEQRTEQIIAQLAEARAENERLNSVDHYACALCPDVAQARQEAAKWVADLLLSPEWEKECHCCEDYYCSICRIKAKFKLEG